MTYERALRLAEQAEKAWHTHCVDTGEVDTPIAKFFADTLKEETLKGRKQVLKKIKTKFENYANGIHNPSARAMIVRCIWLLDRTLQRTR